MKVRSLVPLLVALIAPGLAAAAVGEFPLGEPPPGRDTPSDGKFLSDGQILGILHVANAGEIATAEQAERKGESSAVKEFGTRMVTEHTALSEKFYSLATDLGLTLEPSPVAEYLAGAAEHIRTATEPYMGASYDVLFVDGQLYLHSLVVSMLDWLSTAAEAPELRAAILEARPTILEHLDAATLLRQELGDPPADFTKE